MNIQKVKQALELAKALDLTDEPDTCICPAGEWRIVILQRGWVFVGRYFKEGSMCRLESAYNVRQWGTTKGLGELALNGPTESTKLDPSPIVSFHELTEVASMVCEQGKWKKMLK